MPAPKKQGQIPISSGITHNSKFNFWVIYKCFNKKNIADGWDFFYSKEKAEDHFRTTTSEPIPSTQG